MDRYLSPISCGPQHFLTYQLGSIKHLMGNKKLDTELSSYTIYEIGRLIDFVLT